MPLAHVTKTGNVSIPKKWREELGIEPESSVVMRKLEQRIIIEPLRKYKWHLVLAKIDQDIRTKNVAFSKEEAIKDDLYE